MSRSRKKNPFHNVYGGDNSPQRRAFKRNRRHRTKQWLKRSDPDEVLIPLHSEIDDEWDLYCKTRWSKIDVEYTVRYMMTRNRGDGYWENLQRYMKEWCKCMRK